jgi:hypothetical protein
VIFVDTGAWFAAFVPTDPNHQLADAWMRKNSERLVTTDYVIDELITLLDRRGEQRRGHLARKVCFGDNCAHIEFVTRDDFLSAWDLHDGFTDKQWSFTDCTSKVIMERMGIRTALSFDVHFKQFGTIVVLP